jgi:hypothetical protein
MRGVLYRTSLLAALAAGLAPAQTFPLQLLAKSGNQVAVVANQSTLALAASVGQSQSIQVTATYTGSGKITVAQAPQLLGSTEFTSSLSGTLPLTLKPGDSMSIVILFEPTSATQATAIFTLPFTETLPGIGNQPPTVNTNAITFSLVGSAASFIVSYAKNGNIIPLSNGGAMVFDPQPINTTVTLALNFSNNGTASGQVTALADHAAHGARRGAGGEGGLRHHSSRANSSGRSSIFAHGRRLQHRAGSGNVF